MRLRIGQEERDFRETGKANTSNIYFLCCYMKVKLGGKACLGLYSESLCKGEIPPWNCAEKPQKMEAAL